MNNSIFEIQSRFEHEETMRSIDASTIRRAVGIEVEMKRSCRARAELENRERREACMCVGGGRATARWLHMAVAWMKVENGVSSGAEGALVVPLTSNIEWFRRQRP